MHPLPRLAPAAAVGLALLLSSCGDGHDTNSGEHAGSQDANTTATRDGADNEDGTEDAGEGAAHEGGGEGRSASVPATYLTTSGISRGVFSGPEVQADDYYADKLNDLEFALSYDSTSGSFLGRVKNEANEGLCDSRNRTRHMEPKDGERRTCSARYDRVSATHGSQDAAHHAWSAHTAAFSGTHTLSGHVRPTGRCAPRGRAGPTDHSEGTRRAQSWQGSDPPGREAPPV